VTRSQSMRIMALAMRAPPPPPAEHRRPLPKTWAQTARQNSSLKCNHNPSAFSPPAGAHTLLSDPKRITLASSGTGASAGAMRAHEPSSQLTAGLTVQEDMIARSQPAPAHIPHPAWPHQPRRLVPGSTRLLSGHQCTVAAPQRTAPCSSRHSKCLLTRSSSLCLSAM
jgi:hypothetical protein